MTSSNAATPLASRRLLFFFLVRFSPFKGPLFLLFLYKFSGFSMEMFINVYKSYINIYKSSIANLCGPPLGPRQRAAAAPPFPPPSPPDLTFCGPPLGPTAAAAAAAPPIFINVYKFT